MYKYFYIIDGVATYKACPELLLKYPLFKSIEKLLENAIIDVYFNIRLNEFQLKMYDNDIGIIFNDIKTIIHDLSTPIKIIFTIYNSDPGYCEIFVDKIKSLIRI